MSHYQIISRQGWGAAPPRHVGSVPWSQRTGVCLHHTAGPTGQTVRTIQNFHMDPVPRGRGWNDIGYNFLVDIQGRVYEGRGWTTIGAHASGYNTSYIGVAVIGTNVLTNDAAGAINWLIDQANRRAGRDLDVTVHQKLLPGTTSCPGPKITSWVESGHPVSGSPVNIEGAEMLGLVEGDQGEAVELMQRVLMRCGASLAKYGPDGIWGGETTGALLWTRRQISENANRARVVDPVAYTDILTQLARHQSGK